MSASSTYGQPRWDGTPRWQQILLVLSLSLNLLIAGAVLGAIAMHRHQPRREIAAAGRPGAAMAMMGPVKKFAEGLSKQRRAELADVIAQHAASGAEFNKAIAPVRKEVADAILAAPFDSTRFEASLKRLYDSEAAARMAHVSVSAAFVEHLTNEERTSFLKTLNWMGIAGADKAGGDVQDAPKAP